MAKRQRLTFADKQRLMNAVRAVPVMRDPQHRQQVVDNLIEHFGAQCEPARFQDAKFDSWSIARTCISHNAVFRLVSQLRNIGGASQELRELDSVVREFLSTPAPEVGTQDEICHQITSLLQDVSGDSLAAVLSHPSFAGDSIIEGLAEADDVSTGSSPTATGADAFARLMNGITAGRGRQLLVVFLELAAHQLEEYDFVELHVLAADLIGDSGDRTRIRELCQSLQLTAAEPSDGESTPGEEDPLKTTPAPEKVEPRFTPPAPPTPPVLWGGVPPRNSNFTGREALLDEIYESLDQYMQSALLPQPLHGLGGVGKSQMAVEFAYRYQFGYQLVWWIQADDVRSIRRSLVSLARRMGLPESDDVQDTVDTVLDALRRGTPHARWLLIYDNAPEPGIVHQYLPSGPGHVLITSRSRSWATEANAIEIDVFTPRESTLLLQARWKELTDTDALALADRLGHLPLALEQAIAVHSQTGMPLAGYLTALESHPVAILSEGIPVNYPRSVAQTFGLAYKELKEKSPAAAILLELCAFLSSQPIAIPMLTRGRGAQLPAELLSLLRDDIPLR